MRYENEAQRKYYFTDCCESIEKLIEHGRACRDTLEKYHCYSIGVIAMHQHYDPKRAEKILAYVREQAVAK